MINLRDAKQIGMGLFVEYFPVMFDIILHIAFLLVPLLISMAYLTLAERKIIGWMQLRIGPTRAGVWGMLQPFADALKLMFKEPITPRNADKLLFFIAPMISFIFAMVGWAIVPFKANAAIANINVGILYVIATTSMGVYGIVIAGWASNSKYALFGALRSSAQMISYEVVTSLVVLTVVLATGTLNITEIIEHQAKWPLWMHVVMMPLMVVYFIAILAETNRCPFDLPEAESELVAGYNVEYSSLKFSLFFLGEYLNMILASTMTVILFLGGYYPPLNLPILHQVPGVIWMAAKVFAILFVFIWLRGTLPRYRHDQLMRIGWKLLLPISFVWFMVVAYIRVLM